MTKKTSKVISDARLKMEKDTAPVLPCVEKNGSRGEPQAVVTSVDASEEHSDSENTGACGNVKRQHMDRIAEKGCVGSCHYGSAHELVFIQEALKIPEAQAAVDRTLQMKDNSSVGCQESKTKG